MLRRKIEYTNIVFYWLIAVATIYKFQVEIGATTNQDFKLQVKHRFMVFNLVLRDNYLSVATI